MSSHFGLKFHPLATKEYLKAVDWYNEQQAELGDAFYDTVLDTVKRIAENPLSYPVKAKTYREALVQRFPYVVVFRIKSEKKEVEIMAIFHTSRNPKKKYRK